MPLPILIPFAEHRLDGGPNGDGLGWGTFTADDSLPFCACDHTTETYWIPGYSGGVHPHVTYLPTARRFIQHVRLDRRAGTLRGSSTRESGKSVPTNRAKVIQIEIAAYSAWWIAAKHSKRVAVRDLKESALQDLAGYHSWLRDEFGITAIWYPKPAGNRAHPMSHRSWLQGRRDGEWGICDHATAPDASTHWDSGDLNRGRILDIMGGTVGLPPGSGDDEVMYPRRGDTGDRVKELQAMLNIWGSRLTLDGDYGPATAAEVGAFQTEQGLSETNPDNAGPLTFAALQAGGVVGGGVGPQGPEGPQGPPGSPGVAGAVVATITAPVHMTIATEDN